MEYYKKAVIITGGSRGIGKATVSYFLENNYCVVTTSTSGELDYSHQNLHCVQLDFTKKETLETFINTTHKYTNIDCLINNAWWSVGRRQEDFINIELLSQVLNINLLNTIDLTQKITTNMNQGAVVINIASEYGSLTEDWGFVSPSYRIAKAGLNMFTRNIYKHPSIVQKKIKVYSFDPGWVKTDMGGPDAPRDPSEPAKELYALYLSGNPSGEFYRGIIKRDW